MRKAYREDLPTLIITRPEILWLNDMDLESGRVNDDVRLLIQHVHIDSLNSFSRLRLWC